MGEEEGEKGKKKIKLEKFSASLVSLCVLTKNNINGVRWTKNDIKIKAERFL
jgi:hypothetical protein